MSTERCCLRAHRRARNYPLWGVSEKGSRHWDERAGELAGVPRYHRRQHGQGLHGGVAHTRRILVEGNWSGLRGRVMRCCQGNFVGGGSRSCVIVSLVWGLYYSILTPRSNAE
ncbi:hypothetical protein B296_00042003 [Ensete ventricosum]|uniref:Uncharacterized protein n=1 Tax=Ensete ventricosum TaxID=4639 RepID=A0A426XKI4_ENSVE|nr:hypothetical protein B296_00042003 [Ensete ventricosum]